MDEARISGLTDGFLLALHLIERLNGGKRPQDEAIRNALREVAEGDLTFIGDDAFWKGKPGHLREYLRTQEQATAANLLEGLGVLEQ